MARNSESGHAKNVANFSSLISVIKGFGAVYNPSNQSVTVENLEALAQTATNSLSLVNGVLGSNSIAAFILLRTAFYFFASASLNYPTAIYFFASASIKQRAAIYFFAPASFRQRTAIYFFASASIKQRAADTMEGSLFYFISGWKLFSMGSLTICMDKYFWAPEQINKVRFAGYYMFY